MILVYTGDGKGKTSACIGQALRGLGNGMSVAFGQFIKQDGVAGEQKMLRSLLGESFRPGGIGFYRSGIENERHRSKALELLAWAYNLDVDMLILDEAIYALQYALLSETELAPLCQKYKSVGCLVLSGRGARKSSLIMEIADIITEMENIRHHGANPIAGIEF